MDKRGEMEGSVKRKENRKNVMGMLSLLLLIVSSRKCLFGFAWFGSKGLAGKMEKVGRKR